MADNLETSEIVVQDEQGNKQLVQAVKSLSGTMIWDEGIKTALCVVEDENGDKQLALKTFDLGDGGGGGFDPTQIEGYDATKKQILFNDEGTLKWAENSSHSAPTLTWYIGNTGTTLQIADTTGAVLVKMYRNGLLMEPSQDYTVSGTTLTLTVALDVTDKITEEIYR